LVNQTTTTYETTNLVPGLLYNVTIISFGGGMASPPFVGNFSTGN